MPAPLLALLVAIALPAAALAQPTDEPAPPPAETAPAPEREAPGEDADGAGDREARGEPAEEPDLSPDLDFDLLPEPEAVKVDARLERQVARRRSMLTWHQAAGLATWTALAATTVVGQLDFDDRFRGGGDTGRYHGWHRGLAIGSTGLFLGTGLLAVLAPEPYEKETRLDTATLHQAAMAVTAAGIVTQVVLGVSARDRAGSVRERDLATVHQVVGYATLGAMTLGTVVLFF